MGSVPAFTAPLVIGVQQYRNWQEAGSVEATLAGLGRNTGNMIFTHSLLRVLANASWGSFGLREADLEGRDVIVIACANWINSFEDFGWLADRLEKTSLPVVLVGIGAQASLLHELPSLAPGTRRLLAVAADRSKYISTRGKFSSEVLASLGFKSTVPTGCPSLLLAGEAGPTMRANVLFSPQLTCVHATRHGYQFPSILDQGLYKMAINESMDILLQSETPDIICAVDQSVAHENLEKAGKVLEATYMVPANEASYYLSIHGRCFANYSDWISYMATRSFCVGTRIHGTVASLLAGTPAILIAHDSRTLEMADAMSIPFARAESAVLKSAQDLYDLYRASSFHILIEKYVQYRNRFADFFGANGLSLASLSSTDQASTTDEAKKFRH